jgi:NADH:ubiquinone oxidoreductase subunit D
LPAISSHHAANIATFKGLQEKSKQLFQRIATFNDKTREIYNTGMKLNYSYTSAGGLKEKMPQVEHTAKSVQTRIEKLSERIDVVEKLRLRHDLQRGHRIRWLMLTVVFVGVGLAWAYFRLG